MRKWHSPQRRISGSLGIPDQAWSREGCPLFLPANIHYPLEEHDCQDGESCLGRWHRTLYVLHPAPPPPAPISLFPLISLVQEAEGLRGTLFSKSHALIFNV